MYFLIYSYHYDDLPVIFIEVRRFIENIKIYILKAKHTILFSSKKSLIIIVQTDRVKQINWFSKFNLNQQNSLQGKRKNHQ